MIDWLLSIEGTDAGRSAAMALALLAAQGMDEEFALHVRATANTGASPADLREALFAKVQSLSFGNLDELEQRVINGNTEYFLMPDQRAIVTGSIQIIDNPTGKDRIDFWAGLIHEHVAIDVFNDHVDPQPIVIGF